MANLTIIDRQFIQLNGDNKDLLTNGSKLYATPDAPETPKTFKEAVDTFGSLVFVQPNPNFSQSGVNKDPLNRIYTQGCEFGGGVVVDESNNSFVISGKEYSLGVNESGQLNIIPWNPISGTSINGNYQWERDSGAQTTTWTASVSTSDNTPASGTINYSWQANTAGGNNAKYTGGSISLNIPNNTAVKYTVTASQVSGSGSSAVVKTTKTNSKTCDWWYRRYAFFMAGANETVTVTGITTGGFKFNISGTSTISGQCGTSKNGSYIPSTDSGMFSGTATGKEYTFKNNGSATYSGYIYIICDKTSNFTMKVGTEVGKVPLLADTFEKQSNTAITTYANGTKSLYLFKSKSPHDNMTKIVLYL